MKVKKICQNCEKEFIWEASPSRVKAGWGKFCSRACQGSWTIKKYKPYLLLKGKKSWNNIQKEVICNNCGKRFLVSPYKIKISKTKFCSRVCFHSHLKDWLQGKRHPQWKGGRTYDSDGYVCIKMRNHPNCNKQGYIREHRLVIEEKLGRYLLPTEIIHHLNGDKQDNRPENVIITTRSKHINIHRKELLYA